MALSQIQCLDDHHVNWRVSESKPEFFYSEDQRLALEELLTKGRDGFSAYIREHGIRDFLSDLELQRLECTAEAYRPGHELKPETTGGGNAGSGEEGGDGAVSLQYWPDRSEASVAELDLGWPDAISYRGVTRVTVNTQPPAEGQTHIKEVVRKSIASAQKVIAVVMDVFTDVDIFRDLLDAAYKRRVPVYIIIDTAAVRDFLSMCGRANMHHGHLKNLRVRCCGGVEFYTRSAQKVRGSLSQRFLLIDGDRAISGSYSFTWSSSRLDRNLITVVTGQAVENFDTQFRDLYLTSRGVSLAKVSLTEEPTPDPIPQAAPAPLSASMARKLINPKYALVATGNHASPASSNQNSSNKNPAGLRLLKGRIKEPVELPPLHPGLANLEKVYLIPYLPTWPEPDPPSDVIGFINIRDDKRANQVHLQRSERFEVSQAIRFSSPFTVAAAPTDTSTEGADTDTQPSEGSAAQNQAAAQPTAQPTPQPAEQPHIAPNAQHSSQPCQRADTPREQPAHTPETRTPIAPAATDVTGAPPTNATDHTPTAGASNRPQAPPLEPPQAPPLEPPQAPLLEPPQAPSLEPPQAPPRKPPQAPPQDPPLAPPIPKPRTLQLVINGPGSEHTGQPQVSLVKKSESEALHDSSDYVRTHDAEERPSQSEEEQEEVKASDSSQDSTEVMCDQAANGNPSSLSTASDEEFYDCNQSGEVVVNGMTTGSGRGHRHGDGVNVMARLSQSMLDLRDPSQSGDSADLIHQSQQLRQQVNASPHRHIGQLFQSSRPSNQEQQVRGAKVVIAKPGSYHRPTRASGPVIGGHRYWMGQALQTDSSLLRPEQRSGRSPRRHSPAHRKTGQGSPQPPANLAGVLGLSFSKLTNLKHLRSRAAGSQRKTPQNYKDAI